MRLLLTSEAMIMMLLVTWAKTGSVICAVYLPRHAKIADRHIYIIKRDIHAGRIQHQTLDRFAPPVVAEGAWASF